MVTKSKETHWIPYGVVMRLKEIMHVKILWKVQDALTKIPSSLSGVVVCFHSTLEKKCVLQCYLTEVNQRLLQIRLNLV